MQTLPLKGKRSYGKIASLPPEVRNAVDNMILSCTVRIPGNTGIHQEKADVSVSESTVSRYGKRLADSYRRAVETDLMTMAESAGLECRQAETVVEEDPERPGFGSVLEVKLIVGIPESGSPGPLEGDTEAFRGQGAETWSREENGREAGLERRRRANREIGNLKTRIGEYYGVEEGRIRIDLEDE